MRPTDRFDSMIVFWAQKYDRDPRQVKRQLRTESALNPDAVSPVGAKGIGQFMDRTWAEWCDGTAGLQTIPDFPHLDPFNPDHAIRAHCAYMAALERGFVAAGAQSLHLALAAYNWGPGNVRKLLVRDPANWTRRLPMETGRYLEKNLAPFGPEDRLVVVV